MYLIKSNEKEKWNKLVRGFKQHDIYHMIEYVRSFQIHGDGEPCLFYYQKNDTKALNVVMKRDIALDYKFKEKIPRNTYFDLATPYGYGGFLIEGNNNNQAIEEIMHSYNSFCVNNNIVSEFVRFHPMLENHKELEKYYDILNLGKTIHIDLDSEEQIWSNLTSKNRNVIRKAEKASIEIRQGFSQELMDKFIELYNDTMKRAGAKDYYFFGDQFYTSMMNDMRGNLKFFYAVYEEKIIAISMILLSNKKMHYHLSASNAEYLNLAPTNLLLYKVACWGSDNGYEILHLGGGLGGQEDSLYKFKKSFNRQSSNNFLVGRKIFNQEIYNKLTILNTTDIEYKSGTSFFPAYRI